MDINPGQQRKIRIIEKTFGPDWRDQFHHLTKIGLVNLGTELTRTARFTAGRIVFPVTITSTRMWWRWGRASAGD